VGTGRIASNESTSPRIHESSNILLCAGLTPAWQQILVFDAFAAGQVNRAGQTLWTSSGKVFNAGIAAHHLGGPSMTLALAGGSILGEIEAELTALGVPHRLVHTRTGTRICTTIIDRAAARVTELVENGREVSGLELDAFRRAYVEEVARAGVAVLSGSLPDGTPTTFYRDLLERTHCKAVLDFRGAELMSVLDLSPFVVKPNREELARTVAAPMESETDLHAAMRSLNARGAQWVVVTHGAGDVWLSGARELYRLRPPGVETVVNPIGSGDALAAGIAWATRAGHGIVEAVRLGIAAAGLNVTQLLPCRLDPAAVADWSRRVGVERVE